MKFTEMARAADEIVNEFFDGDEDVCEIDVDDLYCQTIDSYIAEYGVPTDLPPGYPIG